MATQLPASNVVHNGRNRYGEITIAFLRTLQPAELNAAMPSLASHGPNNGARSLYQLMTLHNPYLLRVPIVGTNS